MRAKINILLLSVPMIALAVLFQQCAGVNFENAVLSQQWAKSCKEDASKCRAVSEDFNAGSSNKNIDFVWVVDGSGSMSNEIAYIRENIVNFTQSLSNYSSLKMALIGDRTGTYGIQLPAVKDINGNDVQTKQVDVDVQSSDAFLFAGMALCPKGASNSWCSDFLTNHKDGLGNKINTRLSQYTSTEGALVNFLRPQSHKVFVFVTDDEALKKVPWAGNKLDFLDAYNTLFPLSNPTVYSFVALQERGQAPCSVYGKGVSYMELSASTGGEAFDICESDWKVHLNKMLDGLETMVNTTFPLATQNVVEVTAVYLDGNLLSPGDWSYANRKVTIRPEAMQNSTTYTVRIELIEYID